MFVNNRVVLHSDFEFEMNETWNRLKIFANNE